MRRAWSNARRRIGVEPSSKTGVETGTKKLMGKSSVQESNELPKCQEESALRPIERPTTNVDLESASRGIRANRRWLCSLDWLRSLPTNRSDCFAIGDVRRGRVIFGVLIVVILRQRSIDEIQNDSGNIDLPIVETLKRLLRKTSRGIGKPNDKDGSIDFRRETGGIVRRKNGRTVDDDVIVVLVNFLQERFGRIAQEMFARLGQSLAPWQNEKRFIRGRYYDFLPIYFLFQDFGETNLRRNSERFAQCAP